MSSQQYRKIWADTPDGQIMGELINGDRGFLIYMRKVADPGFSSRCPNYAGPSNAVIEYVLSNGQRDEHPASFAISKCEIDRALEFFVENAGRHHLYFGTTIPEMVWSWSTIRTLE